MCRTHLLGRQRGPLLDPSRGAWAVRRNKRSALRRSCAKAVCWKHLIRDDENFRRGVEYCYINRAKHGLVTRGRDWPHSSFHRGVRSCSPRIGPATSRQRATSASVFERERRNALRLLRPTVLARINCRMNHALDGALVFNQFRNGVIGVVTSVSAFRSPLPQIGQRFRPIGD